MEEDKINNSEKSDNSEEITEKTTSANKQLNTDELLSSMTKTFQKKGILNVYVRRDMMPYVSVFKKIIEAEERDIMKAMSKEQIRKYKRSGVIGLATTKLIKNYVIYKKTHRDEKLLDVNDFLNDGRMK